MPLPGLNETVPSAVTFQSKPRDEIAARAGGVPAGPAHVSGRQSGPIAPDSMQMPKQRTKPEAHVPVFVSSMIVPTPPPPAPVAGGPPAPATADPAPPSTPPMTT